MTHHKSQEMPTSNIITHQKTQNKLQEWLKKSHEWRKKLQSDEQQFNKSVNTRTSIGHTKSRSWTPRLRHTRRY